MSSFTNTQRFKNIVANLVDSLNLERQGIAGKPVGDMVADLIAYGIIVQVDKELDPDGRRLPRLKRWWVQWKARHGYNTKILRMTDAMMNLKEVRGTVVLAKDQLSMFYGITPHEMDKAEWAHEGQHGAHGMAALFSGWRRPPREFYGIGKESWKQIDDYIDNEIDSVIMAQGATRK